MIPGNTTKIIETIIESIILFLDFFDKFRGSL